MPKPSDFVAEPPLLPAQTLLTPLDLPHSEWLRQEPALGDGAPCPAVPVDHAMLNHVFVHPGGGSCGGEDREHRALLLGTCTRYKTKHVVTIVYKPARKSVGVNRNQQ